MPARGVRVSKPAKRRDQEPREENAPQGSPVVQPGKGKGQAAGEEISATESFKEAFERLEADVRAAEDKYLRALADLDNNRKHLVREKANWLRYGHEAVVRDLLPILDNLERVIQAAGSQAEAGDSDAGMKGFLEGVELTIKQFSEVLGKHGVSAIESDGRQFDPRIHEAVQRLERSDVPPGTIIEEFLKGYMLHDRLLRAANVVVSAEAESDGEAPDASPGNDDEG